MNPVLDEWNVLSCSAYSGRYKWVWLFASGVLNDLFLESQLKLYGFWALMRKCWQLVLNTLWALEPNLENVPFDAFYKSVNDMF